jgi:hypothetical protein
VVGNSVVIGFVGLSSRATLRSQSQAFPASSLSRPLNHE